MLKLTVSNRELTEINQMVRGCTTVYVEKLEGFAFVLLNKGKYCVCYNAATLYSKKIH